MVNIKENKIKEENVPKNLRGVADILEDKNNLLDLDDKISFKCSACGKCCVDTTDIILTPVDLCNMSKELKITTAEIIKSYGVVITGGSTGLPIILLKRDKFHRCVLLKDKKCSVHNGKPGACYLYPLGRVLSSNTEDGVKQEVKYFMQKQLCRKHRLKETTVREYIGEKYLKQVDSCSAWLDRYGKLASNVVGDFKEFISNTRVFVKPVVLNGLIETLYIGLENVNLDDLYVELNKRYDKAEELLLEAVELEQYYRRAMEENNLLVDNEAEFMKAFEKINPNEFLSEIYSFSEKYKNK